MDYGFAPTTTTTRTTGNRRIAVGAFSIGSLLGAGTEKSEDPVSVARSVLEKDLGLGSTKKLADDFTFVAPGRKPLTKRRYLQSGYAQTLREACPSLRITVSDVRVINATNVSVRVLATTKWSGGACEEFAPPQWATSDGGTRDPVSTSKDWTAGPFGASVVLDPKTLAVLSLSDGYLLDRDSDDFCDGGADAIYRAIKGGPCSIAKAPGLVVSETLRRTTSISPSKPSRGWPFFGGGAAKKKQPEEPLAPGVAEALARAAVDGIVTDKPIDKLFSSDAVILGPSFAAGSPEAVAFRKPWPSAPIKETLNWRVESDNVVRFDCLLDTGRLEAASVTLNDAGQVTRLAVGFRLDDNFVDPWTELPANVWVERALGSESLDRVVDDLVQNFDGVTKQVDDVTTLVTDKVDAVTSTIDSGLAKVGGVRQNLNVCVENTTKSVARISDAKDKIFIEAKARASRENALDTAVSFVTSKAKKPKGLEETKARSARETSLDDVIKSFKPPAITPPKLPTITPPKVPTTKPPPKAAAVAPPKITVAPKVPPKVVTPPPKAAPPKPPVVAKKPSSPPPKLKAEKKTPAFSFGSKPSPPPPKAAPVKKPEPAKFSFPSFRSPKPSTPPKATPPPRKATAVKKAESAFSIPSFGSPKKPSPAPKATPVKKPAVSLPTFGKAPQKAKPPPPKAKPTPKPTAKPTTGGVSAAQAGIQAAAKKRQEEAATRRAQQAAARRQPPRK